MRILGVDFGSKRVGLALSDETGTIAQSVITIKGGGVATVAREVAQVAQERGAGKIVVGLPLRLDGLVSEQTERTLLFIAKLEAATALPVARWDERLTSVQAERAMLEGDVSRKKRRENIDKIAAQLMLQSYLDACNQSA